MIWYGTPTMLFPERRKRGKRRYPMSAMAQAYRMGALISLRRPWHTRER